MAQSKRRRSGRSQPSLQRRGAGTARSRDAQQLERSSDRQPREEPNRQNIEAPSERKDDRNPSVNDATQDEPSQSRRPGGSGDVSP